MQVLKFEFLKFRSLEILNFHPCVDVLYFYCLTGLFFVYPCMDTVVTVDLRTKSFDIAPQEVIPPSPSLSLSHRLAPVLKTFFINVSYIMLVASLTLMALF